MKDSYNWEFFSLDILLQCFGQCTDDLKYANMQCIQYFFKEYLPGFSAKKLSVHCMFLTQKMTDIILINNYMCNFILFSVVKNRKKLKILRNLIVLQNKAIGTECLNGTKCYHGILDTIYIIS